MTLTIKIFVVLCATAFFSTFLVLIKRGSVKPFYSSLWLLVSLLMFSVVPFEECYKQVANWLNIRDASFLVFVGAIVFLLLYVLHLSIKISELSDRVQELISHAAILDKAVRTRNTEPHMPEGAERAPTAKQL